MTAPPPQPDVPPSGPPGGDLGRALTEVFAAVNRLGVRRSTESWVGGVCGGIARRLGIDPVVVRVGLIVLTLLSGVGLVLYVLAWLLLPAPDGDGILARQAHRGIGAAGVMVIFVGGIVALVATFLSGVVGGGFGDSWPRTIVFVGIIAGAVYLITHRDEFNGLRTWRPGGVAAPAPGTLEGEVDDASSGAQGAGATAYRPAAGAPAAFRPAAYGAPPPAATAPTAPPPPGWATPATEAGARSAEGPTQGVPPTGPAAGGPTAGAYGASAVGLAHRPSTEAPVLPPAQTITRLRRPRLSPWVALTLAGLALVIIPGVSTVHERAGWAGHGVTVGVAAALGLVACVLLVAGLRGRRGGLTSLLALLLTLGLGAGATTSDPRWVSGVGDRSFVVDAAASDTEHRLGLGTMTIAFAQAKPGVPPARQSFDLGAGEVEVRLPASGSVRIESRLAAGAVTVNREPEPGLPNRNVRYAKTFGTGPVIAILDIDIRAGELRITGATS